MKKLQNILPLLKREQNLWFGIKDQEEYQEDLCFHSTDMKRHYESWVVDQIAMNLRIPRTAARPMKDSFMTIWGYKECTPRT